MSEVLEIKNLCKKYPNFTLDNISFSVEKGMIMGFIGRNGAGKTTTLKNLLNLVHPTSGTIEFFGLNFNDNEREIKQRIGYAAGGINYYSRKKLKDIIKITKTFYDNWDEKMYRKYMDMFALDENKKPIELSEGMKVKFNLTIALSHHAELLILDEPTSDLDPVSRDDLLEVFLTLANEGVAILFSTHITSDLDKCADAITYIQKGKIFASKRTKEFADNYRVVQIEKGSTNKLKEISLGTCINKDGESVLIHTSDTDKIGTLKAVIPDLETIMVHLEKENN